MTAVPVEAAGAAAVALLAAATALLARSAQVRARSRSWLVDYGVFVVVGFFVVLGVWLLLNHDESYVRVLLRRYWLAALFAVFVLEGAMLLYFAPSESLVPAAVTLAVTTDVAAAHVGTYALIIATAIAGATVGQYLVFVLAKHWGREWLLERPWFRIGEDRLDRLEYWFDRGGGYAVAVSNTLLFTRAMLTIPAGLADMDDRRFVVASALGTLSFETILAALTLVGLGVLEVPFL